MDRIRLIALDMDGTLLDSRHRAIPPENVDAIRRAEAAGIRVCICTGRMIEDASDFILRFGLGCMVIACNGTRISDGPLPGGHMLLRRQIAPRDARRVIDILKPYGLMVNALEDGRVSTVTREEGQVYHLVRRGVVQGCYGEEAIYAAAERGVMKFYVTADGFAGAQDSPRVQAARRALTQGLPHLQITRSSPGSIEIMPPDTGKGDALAFVAGRLGLPRECVMAMGDAQNDLTMLEYAYHSVAMENACDEVKAICRYRTLSNDECGVAAMIGRVLAARGASA